MITDVLTQPDATLDGTLRPGAFSEFTGQPKVKERLDIAVQAAKQRGDSLDHILLSGPPGLGKTTLAGILSREMGGELKVTSGPTIEKAADLAGLLTNLNKGDVLFIDEIHRLQKNIEEYLYPAMEDFTLDIIIDQGPNARSVRLNLPRFTLIGATTRSGLLTAPLLTRFPVRERLDYYQGEDLQTIVLRSARLLDVEADPDGAALHNFYTEGELKAEGSSIAEGIGQGRITANLEGAPIDTQFRISDEEGLHWVRRLLSEEGLCLGLSSGINVAGAVALARQLGPGKRVATILCDTGFRYLSTLYNRPWLESKGLTVFPWLAHTA